jgi:hypothetical protein
MKYTGPAKPIPTSRRSWIGAVEIIVYAFGIGVLLMDLFIWRP